MKTVKCYLFVSVLYGKGMFFLPKHYTTDNLQAEACTKLS